MISHNDEYNTLVLVLEYFPKKLTKHFNHG